MILLLFIIIFLTSCTFTGCNTYKIPHDDYIISVHICNERTVESEFNKYLGAGYKNITGRPGKVVGFCLPTKHELWSIPDYKVLLHEFWHVLGNLEEPYWEK